MGNDFVCGCRTSMGAWYPCEQHEHTLIALISIEEYKKKNRKKPICEVKNNG